MSKTLNFRYDINALRAIAVVAVLFYHYKIPFFDGGFCGVDIFFVISGYLMSKIIIKSVDNNGFSILEFYSKRLHRIVPALIVLVLIVSLISFFFYFPLDYIQSERNAVTSLLFLSNIFYWRTTDYFGPSPESNILLHTWSLSVEWQFYIIYPLFLILLNKLFKSQLKYLAFFIISIVIFFCFCIFFTRIMPTASFYLLPSRVWELMFGGVAFSLENTIRGNTYKKFLAICGYIMLLLSALLLKTSYQWPGVYTFIPVFGTFLVIVANRNDFKILSAGVIQFIGKISYSLYLWHWPVYVVIEYFGAGTNILAIVASLVISGILSCMSYFYIERSNHFDKTRNLIVITVGAILCTGALSFFNTNEFIFKQKALNLSSYKNDHTKEWNNQFSEGCCFVHITGARHQSVFNKLQCLNLSSTQKNILLIGDSHAAQLSQSLKEALALKNINLVQATSSGCLPLLQPNGDSRCFEIIDYIYHDFLVKNKNHINGIIICGNWLYKAGELDKLADNLNFTLNYIKKYNNNTIVIGQNETYTIPYTTVIAREYQYQQSLVKQYVNDKANVTNRFLLSKLPSVYIDIYNPDLNHPLSPTNEPYMFDDHHFTKYGADIATRNILSDKIASAFFQSVVK